MKKIAFYFSESVERALIGGQLGVSWVDISRVISRVTVVIRGLITPLITTHEPPSSPYHRRRPLVLLCRHGRTPLSARSSQR